MSRHSDDDFQIAPDVLLKAYACGIFPMADSADDPDIYWVEPALRGVLPLDEFHVPKRLKRTILHASSTVQSASEHSPACEKGAKGGRQ